MAVESSSSHQFMGKSRQSFLNQDISPDSSVKSRDWDNTSRWSEQSNPEIVSPSTSSTWKHAHSSTPPGNRNFQKARHMQWVFQLVDVADGLMAKMYKLNQKLDYPLPTAFQFSESFWKAGVIPNCPKLCVHIAKKFPEHPGKLQLERVDKLALDSLYENVEAYLENLEPWLMLLLDLMTFREQALRLILDLSSTVITLLPHQNSLILHAFMDLFCAFVRVNLLSDKVPRKMIVQIYNLLHTMLRSGRDYEFYHRLVQFIDSYDPPLKGLHEDLNFVSPRIGEVLEAVGPIIFLAADTQKLRNEGFLSPFHPRYPDILTNSAHPMRAQDLANVNAHRDWVLLGYLVCPSELLRITGIDIAMAVLKENLVLSLYRDECILLHEEYQLYVLPKIQESKKMAKAGRAKQKEADAEYNIAKQVEKMICDVHEQAIGSAEGIHRERRILLKQEIGRMVLFFSDQPSLLAPNIQMVFSALALARSEVMWYFRHIGVVSVKSKATRVVPVEIDSSDPTVGFLLDGMDKLCSLVRKYVSAIRGYALAYLASAADRIRFLLGSAGMVALDIDAELRNLFQQVIGCLEKSPKPHGENVSIATADLSDFRKNWLSVLMVVTSSRSSINIRHLEKATISTGKEGLVSEGNAAYVWSRSVDELEDQLSTHACVKQLYYYRQHLTVVFRNTMFGPEGRPQHCCAWLGVASSFPDNATVSVPEELIKIGRDAVSYVESLIESIMGGLEGLINILDSESGFGSLEYKLLPEQAAIRMNHAVKVAMPSTKSMKNSSDLPLPGNESEPANRDTIKMLEAAVQRLTSLCSVLNEMEPICILNHVFVLREYLRDCVLSNFRRRFITILKIDRDLQRPSVLESLVHRHMNIVHLVEQHVSMDLTQGMREVLLSEAYSGPMHGLHTFEKHVQNTGTAISIICDWYLENVVKDLNGAGILFTPIDKCFKSARPVGGYFAEAVTDLSELKAFVRLFGPYGVDKLDGIIREHLTTLLNCIDTTLRSNKESLEALSTHMHNWTERDYYLKQVRELEALINFSIQAGQALCFSSLLAEAAGQVLDANTPLLFEDLVISLKQYPAKYILTGDCLFFDFDANAIQKIIDELNSRKFNIMVTSTRRYSENITYEQTENWFGTKYTEIDMPEKWLSLWKNATALPEFSLPEPNPFIADDFTILYEEGRTIPMYPTKILDNDLCELWFRQDDKFLLPTACYSFYFKTPHAIATIDDMIQMTLLATLLKYQFVEKLYPATCASLEYSCYAADLGLVLKVSGFNQKLHLIVDVFSKCLKSLADDTTEKQFTVFVEQHFKTYENIFLRPKVLAKELRLNIIESHHQPLYEKNQRMRSITFSDFQAFCLKYCEKVKIKAIMQGNIQEDHALNIMHNVLNELNCGKVEDPSLIELRTTKLPVGANYLRCKTFHPKDVNTIITNFYQIGPISHATHILIDLLSRIAKQPLFDTLRTKEQLAYDVSFDLRDNYGILGYSITVNSQESKFSADHVDERIENFRRELITIIETMPDDDFEAIKASLSKIKLKEDNKLSEEVQRNFAEITTDEYEFDRPHKEVECLSTISKAQLLEFYQTYYGNAERKLSIQIIGSTISNSQEKETEVINDMSAEFERKGNLETRRKQFDALNYVDFIGKPKGNLIQDLMQFKNSLEVFSVSKTNRHRLV